LRRLRVGDLGVEIAGVDGGAAMRQRPLLSKVASLRCGLRGKADGNGMTAESGIVVVIGTVDGVMDVRRRFWLRLVELVRFPKRGRLMARLAM